MFLPCVLRLMCVGWIYCGVDSDHVGKFVLHWLMVDFQGARLVSCLMDAARVLYRSQQQATTASSTANATSG